MKILKGYLWLLTLSSAAYVGVIIAMLYGWGLEPKSWCWIIVGYFIAHITWPVCVCIRQLFVEKVGEGE